MAETITYRRAKVEEYQQLHQLIKNTFDQFVAPAYSQEGIEEFYKFIAPDLIEKRLKRKNIFLVAVRGSKLVGMIEVRNVNHIALLFVDSDHQGRGIGSELFRHARGLSKELVAGLSTWSVNAAPNSLEAYVKMGFRQLDEEQLSHGIRYFPMEYRDEA